MGRFSVIGLCLLATVLSVPAASHTGLMTWLSIASAATAFVAMSLNQFLATRPMFLESAFGGLDRIYRMHKQLGIAALVLILVHYVVTPNFKGSVLTTGLNDLAGKAGEIGLYGLVALILLSIVKRIPKIRQEFPYHLWRQTHRFIGVFFIFIAVHLNFIKRPFDGTAWLAVYLNAFALLGIASFVYTQFRSFLRRRAYRVTAIERVPTATLVSVEPVGKPIKARPGQFAFLSASRPGLREPHPFTIARHAGDGSDGSLTFAIKPLGDYTKRLRETLEVGDRVMLEGGYGRFSSERGASAQIWIAGGIGITPFMAMAHALRHAPERRVHLVHCIRDKSEAIEAAALQAMADALDNFSFTLHCSSEQGRLKAEHLVAISGVEPKSADVYFCGPAAMRKALLKGLQALGQAPRQIHYEQFEFR
ncbi:Nitric oxide dioxygenase [Hartmannibacter diazotrophicus]|uniref:Nitric oxide dioxygenase n=1 Tax=Hartmannibacter diazotrophicus TaxID=1482074 RepID=A0A2C9D2S2_9HYPH|nr:ferric reductase-like transmembrane domain-containing protein [Hartmannibacter diazotrophicus]SON54560.1 Nitric oxide dioxygenase [Hartmannibacter diazotrophicus]